MSQPMYYDHFCVFLKIWQKNSALMILMNSVNDARSPYYSKMGFFWLIWIKVSILFLMMQVFCEYQLEYFHTIFIWNAKKW